MLKINFVAVTFFLQVCFIFFFLSFFFLSIQNDITRCVPKEDIQEIVSSQSQKREIGIHRQNSSSGVDRSSASYASMVTKSNTLVMHTTVPSLPPPQLPMVPGKLNSLNLGMTKKSLQIGLSKVLFCNTFMAY